MSRFVQPDPHPSDEAPTALVNLRFWAICGGVIVGYFLVWALL